MDATVTTLHRQIEREERLAGIRPDGGAVPDTVITRRQVQVAVVLAAVSIALLGIAFGPRSALRTPVLQALTVALAVCIAIYAVEQDRHLRRLRSLSHDAQRVNLAVAEALSHSGVLDLDDEVLLLRDGLRDAGSTIAQHVCEFVGAEFARVRVPGPTGELSTRLARHAMRRATAIIEAVDDDRAVLAVPVWYDGEPVAVVEAISRPGQAFTPEDAAALNAFTRGAMAVLRT